MTENEAKKLLAVMTVTYPNYKLANVDFAAKVWSDMLGEFTYGQAGSALKAYIRSDVSGFAPTPGQIINQIAKMTIPEELNEMEAWALVSKAIRNSGYNSVDEFSRLPSLVQSAVGTPEQLRVWALDQNYNETVVSSNFIKAYRMLLSRQSDLSKLPEEIKRAIQKANESSYSSQIRKKNAETIKLSSKAEKTKIGASEELTGHTGMNAEQREKWKRFCEGAD